MRAATDSGVIALGSAQGVLVTSCTSSTMPKIGTRNDASTTTISCCGVLMNEECWSCVFTGLCLLVGKGVILASSLNAWTDKGKACYPARLQAPVAQRIRVLASEAKGRGFESRRARQPPLQRTHCTHQARARCRLRRRRGAS